jgi:high-affinity nickel permease
MSILIALSAAFILGVQHAFEPDHVVAISTIATRTKSMLKSLETGSLWGLGHTLTLLVAGMLLILLKVQLPVSIAASFELGVGFMLIVLGIWAIVSLKEKKLHLHAHSHNGKIHTHIHSHAETKSHEHAHVPFSVGIVHGLAGSGALVILIMSSMTDVVQGFFFIVSFGVGLILAMSLIASALGLPSAFASKSSALIGSLFSGGAAFLSIALGAFILLSFFF